MNTLDRVLPTATATPFVRRTFGAILGGAILVVIGALWALELAGVVSIDPTIILPSVLIMIGVALVIGAWDGPHNGLVVAGVPLSIAVVAAAAIPLAPFAGGVGERRYTITEQADLLPHYQVGLGTIVLDLRDLELVQSANVAIAVGAGDVTVLVPDDMALSVDAGNGAGELDLMGESIEGVAVNRQFKTEGFDLAPVGLTRHLNPSGSDPRDREMKYHLGTFVAPWAGTGPTPLSMFWGQAYSNLKELMVSSMSQLPPHRNLVAAVDGSPLSERALMGAAVLARLSGARLHVFHAAPSPVTARKVAESVASKLGDQAHDLTIREVDPGSPNPAAAIAAYASEVGGAVVALGTHGRGSLGTALLGSTAFDLITTTALPLLAYGPAAGDATATARVIACVDGTEVSELSLGEGSRWASVLRVPIWLVQVVPPGLPPYVTYFENTYVHNLAKELDSLDVKIEREVLHSLDPARALVETFAEDPANLIIMATHGRRGLERVRLGSVVTDVLRHSWAPLVIIPPQAPING